MRPNDAEVQISEAGAGVRCFCLTSGRLQEQNVTVRLCSAPGLPPLDFGERFGVPTLGFSGVTRLQAALLLALANNLAQVYSFSEPKHTAARMLAGT
jgi:hypothetical protein